jgi:hypothetical protein
MPRNRHATAAGKPFTFTRATTNRFLQNSYNFAIAAVSKTYAPSGTCARAGRTAQLRAVDVPQGRSPKCGDGCRSIIRRNRSIQMMDILMVALGLAFFAAAIGYAYTCERL